MLQIVFWSVLFAIGLTQVRGRSKETMLGFCEAVAEVMFKFTGIVMKFAPIAVAAALAVTVGQPGGLKKLQSLALVVVTLYVALVAFGLFVLYPVARLSRVPIRPFIAAVKEPALIAFSTASSEAALPKAMERMEALGVPRRIVAFVMPTGYSFNLDGSTLYGDGGLVSSPGRDGDRVAWCGCVDGHGADDREPYRELPGDRRDGSLGRGVRRVPRRRNQSGRSRVRLNSKTPSRFLVYIGHGHNPNASNRFSRLGARRQMGRYA